MGFLQMLEDRSKGDGDGSEILEGKECFIREGKGKEKRPSLFGQHFAKEGLFMKTKLHSDKKSTLKKTLSGTEQAKEDTKNYLREMRRSQLLESQEAGKMVEESPNGKRRTQDTERNENLSILQTKKPKKGDFGFRAVNTLMEKACFEFEGVGYSSAKPNPMKIEGGFTRQAKPILLKNSKKSQKKSEIRMSFDPPSSSMWEMFNKEKADNIKLNKRADLETLAKDIHFCEVHKYKKIEFICSVPGCFKEMCSMCILQHSEHIGHIKHLSTHIEEQYERVKDMDLKKIKQEINKNEEQQTQRLEQIYSEVKDLLHNKITQLKDDLVFSNNKIRKSLHHMMDFKQQFQLLDHNPRMLEFTTFFPPSSTHLIKSCISFPRLHADYGINVESKILHKRLQSLLDDNLSMTCAKTDFNSVGPDVPKFLHWFEWGERNLHLYDIVNNTSRTIRLINNIKIPNFSRSIVVPDGKIFLLGGEDPEGHPKKEIYQFDLLRLDGEHVLEPKALMPHQKYDFTLCYMDGFIYVICGKDTSSEAVNICEK